MDAFSAGSHAKAAAADFGAEIAPIAGLDRDESVRPATTPEILAGLRPAFADPGYAERFPQMLTGVIPATEKVLRRAGLALSDIELFQVNEAFASVVLAWLRETGADPAKVDVNGAANALVLERTP
ncbi:hypothetical protein [Nonomuraea sp. NPDC052265]|uniref:hypothetical protein n=1 Tax=Nonomuraea sp. NPDC052265 TaxID=3364374 RepID=UPI0037C97B9E